MTTNTDGNSSRTAVPEQLHEQLVLETSTKPALRSARLMLQLFLFFYTISASVAGMQVFASQHGNSSSIYINRLYFMFSVLLFAGVVITGLYRWFSDKFVELFIAAVQFLIGFFFLGFQMAFNTVLSIDPVSFVDQYSQFSLPALIILLSMWVFLFVWILIKDLFESIRNFRRNLISIYQGLRDQHASD